MYTLFTVQIFRNEMTQCRQPEIAGGYALKFCYDNWPWYWKQRTSDCSESVSYLAEASCYVHQTPHIVCPATVFPTLPLCLHRSFVYEPSTPIPLQYWYLRVRTQCNKQQSRTCQDIWICRHGCHISNTVSHNRNSQEWKLLTMYCFHI